MQKGLGIYIGHALQATCSENRHQPLLREAVATTEMRHQFQKHGSITTETSALSVKNLCDGTATVTAAALVLHARPQIGHWCTCARVTCTASGVMEELKMLLLINTYLFSTYGRRPRSSHRNAVCT
jgi:hypothetical protein